MDRPASSMVYVAPMAGGSGHQRSALVLRSLLRRCLLSQGANMPSVSCASAARSLWQTVCLASNSRACFSQADAIHAALAVTCPIAVASLRFVLPEKIASVRVSGAGMVAEPPRYLTLHTQTGCTVAGGSAAGLQSLPPPTQQVPRQTTSRLKPPGLDSEAGNLGTQGSQAAVSPPWFAR